MSNQDKDDEYSPYIWHSVMWQILIFLRSMLL